MLHLTVASVLPELQRIARAGADIAYGVYAWLLVLAFSVAVGLPGLLFADRRRLWRLNHRAAGWLIRALHIPFSVSWEADVDLSAPHIIVTNHCSYVDSIFIGAILPELHLFVAKTELQRAPVLRRWLRRIGTIFIERFDAVQSAAEVRRLQRELELGNSIVIFPEGTFTRATGLRPFHLGAFQVAVASGAAVVPLTLRGTRSVLRDGQRLLRRMPVSAVVGRALAAGSAEDQFAAAVHLRDMVRQQILARCGEPDLF